MSGNSRETEHLKFDSSSLTLRSVADSDLEALYRLFAFTHDDLGIAVADWSKPQRDTFFRIQFQARQDQYRNDFPDLTHQVVSCHEELIGQLIFTSGDKEIHLVDISLLPRVQNQGIGTFLLRGLLDRGSLLDKPVGLQVHTGNPAYRLYQRLGFLETGSDELFRRMTWTPPGN